MTHTFDQMCSALLSEMNLPASTTNTGTQPQQEQQPTNSTATAPTSAGKVPATVTPNKTEISPETIKQIQQVLQSNSDPAKTLELVKALLDKQNTSNNPV